MSAAPAPLAPPAPAQVQGAHPVAETRTRPHPHPAPRTCADTYPDTRPDTGRTPELADRADNWERYAATLVTWGLRDTSVDNLPKMCGDSDLPYGIPSACTRPTAPRTRAGAVEGGRQP